VSEVFFFLQVRAVRLRRDRIVVALEHKVLSYNFADLKLLHQIETLGNSRGLLALSSAADATVLACPGLHTGQVGEGGVLWQAEQLQRTVDLQQPHCGAAHLCSSRAGISTANRCRTNSSRHKNGSCVSAGGIAVSTKGGTLAVSCELPVVQDARCSSSKKVGDAAAPSTKHLTGTMQLLC
jgi:hypothetical protein